MDFRQLAGLTRNSLHQKISLHKMEWIEKVPVDKPGQSMWTEENGLRQGCGMPMLTDAPLDPFFAGGMVLHADDNLFFGKRDFHQSIGLSHNLFECSKQCFGLCVDLYFPMLDKTAFMFENLWARSPIVPYALDVSGMCFFECVPGR